MKLFGEKTELEAPRMFAPATLTAVREANSLGMVVSFQQDHSSDLYIVRVSRDARLVQYAFTRRELHVSAIGPDHVAAAKIRRLIAKLHEENA